MQQKLKELKKNQRMFASFLVDPRYLGASRNFKKYKTQIKPYVGIVIEKEKAYAHAMEL